MQLKDKVENWLQQANEKVANGGLTAADLEELKDAVKKAMPRQRLLYLHTRAGTVYSPVIGMADHKPIKDHKDEIRGTNEWPYETVHDALVDGWQIIHFPLKRAVYDDRELDHLGYEFILQKLEEVIE